MQAAQSRVSGESPELDLLRNLDSHLADLLELAPAQRALALSRIQDRALAARLAKLIELASDEVDAILPGAALAGPVARDWLDQQERPGLEPGQLFGGFRIEERIGRGGMSEVYRASRDYAGFSSTIALKLLHRERDSAAATGLMVHEQRALARLEHPGIARFIDAGRSDCGRAWMAMEYVDGEPIMAFADRRRLDLRARVRLLIELLGALEHAHARGLVHADIKSSNVLVDASGRLRLVDFGIAREIGAEAAEGQPSGLTPDCAAPEQLRGELPTTATDLYQVGALAWRLLCGLPRPRSEGHGVPLIATPSDVLMRAPRASADGLAHARGERHAGALAAKLRGDLDALIFAALAEHAQLRPAGCAAFREDLQAWLEHRPLRVRPRNLVSRMALGLKRNPLASAIGLAGVLLVVGGSSASLWQVWQAERAMHAEAARALRIERFLNDLFASASPYLREGEGNPLETLAALGTELMIEGHDLDPQTRVRLGLALARLQLAAGSPSSAQPMLDALARAADESGAPDARTRAELAVLRAQWLADTEQLDQAIVQAEQAVALHGADPSTGRERALAQALLGEYRRRQGDLGAAGRAFAQAVPLLLDPGRPLDVAQVRALASWQRYLVATDARSDMQALLAFLDQQVPAGQEIAGVLGAELVTLKAEIASALLGPEQALSGYIDAAERLERMLAPDHPRVARALTNACVSALESGQFGTARQNCERALPIYAKAYGSGSDEVAVVLANLAALELNSGHPVAARKHLDQARVLFERQAQPYQLLYADLLAGRIADSRGDAAAALAAFDRAEALRLTHFDGNVTLSAEIALARSFVLIELGQTQAAGEALSWLETLPADALQADRARTLAWAAAGSAQLAAARGQREKLQAAIDLAEQLYATVPGHNAVELAWLRSELADAAWRAGAFQATRRLSALALQHSSLEAAGVHYAQAWSLWRLAGGAMRNGTDASVRELLDRESVVTRAAHAYRALD